MTSCNGSGIYLRPFYGSTSPALTAEQRLSPSAGSSCWDNLLPPTPLDANLSEASGHCLQDDDAEPVSSSTTPLHSDHLQSPQLYQSRAMAPDQLLAAHAVHYNTCPSDLAAWVDSMLSQLVSSDKQLDCSSYYSHRHASLPQQQPLSQQRHDYPQLQEEDIALQAPDDSSAIRLVHLLMACAESVHLGSYIEAAALVTQCRSLLLSPQLQATGFAMIAKVADCFIEALARRICFCLSPCSPTSDQRVVDQMPYQDRAAEAELLYHGFYEAAPYLKFAHFTANQGILEAVAGRPAVHVVDIGLPHGGTTSASTLLLQWPAFLQALALRPGGPPSLRLTVVSAGHVEQAAVRAAGDRLTTLARSLGIRFEFRGVYTRRLEDMQPWMLVEHPEDPLSRVVARHCVDQEAVAVNCVLQLHRLLASEDEYGGDSRVAAVLQWVRALSPVVVAVVEQEADHNKSGFLGRFTDALFYYSTIFDSLEASSCRGDSNLAAIEAAEGYLRREIRDLVCCEGASRQERHEPLVRWRWRMERSGFRTAHLGSGAFRQASMLLALFAGAAADGYEIREDDGCLLLGWHGRALFSASAWKPAASNDQDSDVVYEAGSINHKASGHCSALAAATSDDSTGGEAPSWA